MTKVLSSKFQVAGWFLAAGLGGVLSLTGYSQERVPKPSAVTSADITARPGNRTGQEDAGLLMRVWFAGTKALMADTNAVYLTNITTLPETAALEKRILEKFTSLPGRLVSAKAEDKEKVASSAITNHPSTNLLGPVFAELLRVGFVLELRGDSNGVASMSLAAKASPEVETRWSKALASAAGRWFETKPAPLTTGHSWTAGDGTVHFKSTNGWATWVILRQSSSNRSPLPAPRLSTPTSSCILEVEMASTLLPGPIRRSVYGGFERLHISVSPTNQTLKITGKASYKHDLPKLGTPPTIPTNLIFEADASFTMVRHPAAWLEPQSPLYRFLPDSMPEVVYFWSGRSSPFGMFMAMPFAGPEEFISHFGPQLRSNLAGVATATYSGPVVLDTNRLEIQWQSVPFTAPIVSLKESGTNSFLIAEASPLSYSGSGLTASLRDRALAHTNSVIFDWEFTQAQLDIWFRVGQLALMIANQEQLRSDSSVGKWLQSASRVLPNGGNMFTEIAQTGPRELSLDRRSTLAFSSIELFWLANWLESPNFPAANFLVPNPNWDTQKDTLK